MLIPNLCPTYHTWNCVQTQFPTWLTTRLPLVVNEKSRTTSFACPFLMARVISIRFPLISTRFRTKNTLSSRIGQKGGSTYRASLGDLPDQRGHIIYWAKFVCQHLWQVGQTQGSHSLHGDGRDARKWVILALLYRHRETKRCRQVLRQSLILSKGELFRGDRNTSSVPTTVVSDQACQRYRMGKESEIVITDLLDTISVQQCLQFSKTWDRDGMKPSARMHTACPFIMIGRPLNGTRCWSQPCMLTKQPLPLFFSMVAGQVVVLARWRLRERSISQQRTNNNVFLKLS